MLFPKLFFCLTLQDQLRQLNDMGFTDYNRNISALRRTGGNVEAAIEMLVSGTI